MADRIVRVEWWDHAGTGGDWQDQGEAAKEPPEKNVTVGKWLGSDRLCIRLASTYDARADGRVSHVSIILKSAVISIRRLVERSNAVPGKKMKSVNRPKVYEALRDKGLSKTQAAKIANSQKAAHRKARGR